MLSRPYSLAVQLQRHENDRYPKDLVCAHRSPVKSTITNISPSQYISISPSMHLLKPDVDMAQSVAALNVQSIPGGRRR